MHQFSDEEKSADKNLTGIACETANELAQKRWLVL
jgi:hypothetical protein